MSMLKYVNHVVKLEIKLFYIILSFTLFLIIIIDTKTTLLIIYIIDFILIYL